ncbi:MAG: efflux RND transporter permease subunit, partial [Hyphomonadaceae bacterium]|nr:efflux RND transporter permease subunit [Hyphomonadaceae bacterium]
GTIETTAGDLQLRARSLANTEQDFEEIIIRQTAAGGVVRLGDIATVIDGFSTNKFSSRFKGENSAVYQVLSPDTMDITAAGEAIRKFEKEIRETLPPGLTFTIWFDGSTMFDSRMNLIGTNAVSGLILVLIILMLFLRPSVALWVTIGIAAAFAGAVAIAPHVGVTLNMISLFAFLLVVGIVVDDAIVVGESVHFHAENGIDGENGAVAGANMVAKPVFYAVITTILMFTPFLFMTGPIQAMLGQISLVVIAVLAFSLIEAFLVLPVHLRHLKHTKQETLGPLMKMQNRIAGSLVGFAKNVFRPATAALIKYRYVTFATFVGLFIMFTGFLRAGLVPAQFVPQVESDFISFEARFPEGTSFERRNQVRAQVDAGLTALNEKSGQEFGVDEDIFKNYGTFVGGRSVQGFFSLMDGNKRRHVSTKSVAEKLEEYVGPIPDAFRVNYGYTAAGGNDSGGIFFAVASVDPDKLQDSVLAIKEHLETYSSVVRAWDSLESSAKEIQFELKPGAATLGLTLSDVTRQVREAFFGREVQRLPRNGEDVRVMVRYPEEARESIESLRNLQIRAPDGVEVPLFSVADVSFEEGVSSINRRDRKRVEYVGARVRGDSSKVSDIRREMNESFFPEWQLQHPAAERIVVGDDEIERNFVRELKTSLVVILFIMYGLLAIAFKSYWQPLLIMVAVPFALVGMIFGNIVTGVPFTVMSVFGFFAASGVAVNDNLVLIDYVNRLRARGIGAYQAMLDACVARFRPILLTSVTTFVGITPILFETSTQAEFLKPMVVALAFGVLFDFFLTLMLVPAMYGIGVDIKRLFARLWTGVKQPPLGSSYDPNVALALETVEAERVLQALPDTGPGKGPNDRGHLQPAQ